MTPYLILGGIVGAVLILLAVYNKGEKAGAAKVGIEISNATVEQQKETAKKRDLMRKGFTEKNAEFQVIRQKYLDGEISEKEYVKKGMETLKSD